ncbi:MAG TPA: hypothetical protein VMM76_23025 [Pirellulaceae bacterium]|nr:hypothetical protein [Pirellulaceae bacterium]
MTYKRGDVVLALFPDSNLRTAKPRPVLVVQADNLSTGLENVIRQVVARRIRRCIQSIDCSPRWTGSSCLVGEQHGCTFT